MYCKICKKEKLEQTFYKGFKECKDCLKGHLNKLPNTVTYEKVKELLQNNNYVVNEELLHSIFFSDEDNVREKNNIGRLGHYLKDINTLPQYNKYRIKVVEKSDIEFINDDIKQLKKNIEKAIQKEDFNAHNKWMNCLRDAIELRETLLGGSKYTINLGTVNVNSNNGIEFLNEVLELANQKASLKSYK